MSPPQLALLCLGLSRVRTATGLSPGMRTLRAWFSASAAAAQRFTPQDLAQSLSALSVLGAAPPADWLQLVLQCTKPGLAAAAPGTLAVTLWALGRLRYRPGWQWMLAYLEATQAAATRATTQAVATAEAPTQAAVSRAIRSSPREPSWQSVAASSLQPGLHISSDGAAQGQLSWQDVAMVLGGLARLNLRPLQAWTEAIMTVMATQLEQLQWDSMNSTGAHSNQQQQGEAVLEPGPGRTADALVTACWALFRLRIVPGPGLLQLLVTASQHAMPHLPIGRQAALLWSLGKLARGAAGPVSDKARSRRRRVQLLGSVGRLVIHEASKQAPDQAAEADSTQGSSQAGGGSGLRQATEAESAQISSQIGTAQGLEQPSCCETTSMQQSQGSRPDPKTAPRPRVWRRRLVARMSRAAPHRARRGRGRMARRRARTKTPAQLLTVQEGLSSLCMQFVRGSTASLQTLDVRSLGLSLAAVWSTTSQHGACGADHAAWLAAWLTAHAHHMDWLLKQQHPHPQHTALSEVLLSAAHPLSKLLTGIPGMSSALKHQRACIGSEAHSQLQPALASWAQRASALVVSSSALPHTRLHGGLVSRAVALSQIAMAAGQAQAAVPVLEQVLGKLQAAEQARAAFLAQQQQAGHEAQVAAAQPGSKARGRRCKGSGDSKGDAQAGGDGAQELGQEFVSWLRPVDLLQLAEAVLVAREGSHAIPARLAPNSKAVQVLAAQLSVCAEEQRLPHGLCTHAADAANALVS